MRFHLYINTAPCGDARIFSPHEASGGSSGDGGPGSDKTIDRHPNRKARGQLRTKIESGEGTIPVKSSDGIQTWDGVLQGSRLLTMSCSGRKNVIVVGHVSPLSQSTVPRHTRYNVFSYYYSR